VTFVGASAWQIVPAVFGLGVQPIPDAAPGSPERRCAEGVRALAASVTSEGQSGSLLGAPPLGGSDRAGGPGAVADWEHPEPVRQACEAARAGLDAWAALLRLRSAAEQLPPGSGTELERLRRDVAAHLSADLR
jgi:hypothetical protein